MIQGFGSLIKSMFGLPITDWQTQCPKCSNMIRSQNYGCDNCSISGRIALSKIAKQYTSSYWANCTHCDSSQTISCPKCGCYIPNERAYLK